MKPCFEIQEGYIFGFWKPENLNILFSLFLSLFPFLLSPPPLFFPNLPLFSPFSSSIFPFFGHYPGRRGPSDVAQPLVAPIWPKGDVDRRESASAPASNSTSRPFARAQCEPAWTAPPPHSTSLAQHLHAPPWPRQHQAALRQPQVTRRRALGAT